MTLDKFLLFFLFLTSSFAHAQDPSGFKSLPDEIQSKILAYLPLKELLNCAKVDHHFHRLIGDEALLYPSAEAASVSDDQRRKLIKAYPECPLISIKMAYAIAGKATKKIIRGTPIRQIYKQLKKHRYPWDNVTNFTDILITLTSAKGDQAKFCAYLSPILYRDTLYPLVNQGNQKFSHQFSLSDLPLKVTYQLVTGSNDLNPPSHYGMIHFEEEETRLNHKSLFYPGLETVYEAPDIDQTLIMSENAPLPKTLLLFNDYKNLDKDYKRQHQWLRSCIVGCGDDLNSLVQRHCHKLYEEDWLIHKLDEWTNMGKNLEELTFNKNF